LIHFYKRARPNRTMAVDSDSDKLLLE